MTGTAVLNNLSMTEADGKKPTETRRVLLASTLYYPNIGGVENSLFHLSQSYRREGFTPWLLVSTGGDPYASGRWFEAHRIQGIPVLRYKFSRIAIVRLLRAWMGLRILQSRFTVEAMVSRDQHSAVAAVLEQRPCVYLVPGIHSEQHKPEGWNPLRWVNHVASTVMQQVALRRTSRVAVFSEAMAKAVEREAGRTGVERVQPGVDDARFTVLECERRNEGRHRLGLPVDAIIAVTVGRFAGLKRFDLAIGALAHLPESWHLVLVGDGPERIRLEQLVSDSGLQRRVTFAGQISDPERFLQIADVYVLSSEKETFGQVLLEAMACGLPVVAFDSELPGVDTATNEVVPEEWLYKTYRKDTEALAASMCKALASPTAPQQISAWARRTYSWTSLADQLLVLGAHQAEQ